MRALKISSAAKHRGRHNTKYSFELSGLHLVSGLPTNLSATGITVQCSRGAKISSTKEVDLSTEAKQMGGTIAWER